MSTPTKMADAPSQTSIYDHSYYAANASTILSSILSSDLEPRTVGLIALRTASALLQVAARLNWKEFSGFAPLISEAIYSINSDRWHCSNRLSRFPPEIADDILRKAIDYSKHSPFIGFTKRTEAAIVAIAYFVALGTRVSECHYEAIRIDAAISACVKVINDGLHSICSVDYGTCQECICLGLSHLIYASRGDDASEADDPSILQVTQDFIGYIFNHIGPDESRIEIREIDDLAAIGDFDEEFWQRDPMDRLRIRLMGRRGWLEVLNKEPQLLQLEDNPNYLAGVRDIGPVYNAVDINGIPIPFGIVRPHQAMDNDALSSFSGIKQIGEKIAILGEPAGSDDIPIIFRDDVCVALALTFGSSDGPVVPHFGLEPVRDIDKGHQRRSITTFKEFNPEWLKDTDFGKSMYYADELLGGIVGRHSPISSVTSLIATASPNYFKGEGGKLIYSISNTGKRGVDDIHGCRFCIKLKDIDVETTDKGDHFWVTKAGCYIESSVYKRIDDGSIDRGAFLNDREFAHGDVAGRFTENWEEISRMFPVFKRVENLLIMWKVLSLARQSGWILDDDQRAAVRQALAGLPHTPRNTLYVPFGYHGGGCDCAGHWPWSVKERI